MTKLDNKDYSLIVRLLSFSVPSKSEHKRINREKFIDATLGNPQFEEKLKKGQLPGLFTHSSRDSRKMNRSIPYVDDIIRDPDFCNFTAAMDIDGDDVYVGINLIDYGKGLLLKEMIRNRPDKDVYPISVSMATRAHVTSTEYLLSEYLGVDFTLKPDLDAEIMSINFSEEDRLHRINSPLEVVSFCENPRSMENVNFSAQSINQYMREMKFQAYRILMIRMNDVIQWCKSHDQDEISTNINILKSYIDGYVYQWVLASMNEPKSDFNLILALRLNRYCKDQTSVRQLQRNLRLIRQQLISRGAITPDYQKRLNESFNLVMAQLYDFIDERLQQVGKTFNSKIIG